MRADAHLPRRGWEVDHDGQRPGATWRAGVHRGPDHVLSPSEDKVAVLCKAEPVGNARCIAEPRGAHIARDEGGCGIVHAWASVHDWTRRPLCFLRGEPQDRRRKAAAEVQDAGPCVEDPPGVEGLEPRRRRVRPWHDKCHRLATLAMVTRPKCRNLGLTHGPPPEPDKRSICPEIQRTPFCELPRTLHGGQIPSLQKRRGRGEDRVVPLHPSGCKLLHGPHDVMGLHARSHPLQFRSHDLRQVSKQGPAHGPGEGKCEGGIRGFVAVQPGHGIPRRRAHARKPLLRKGSVSAHDLSKSASAVGVCSGRRSHLREPGDGQDLPRCGNGPGGKRPCGAPVCVILNNHPSAGQRAADAVRLGKALRLPVLLTNEKGRLDHGAA